ncbi:MAG: zinc ABC transporter substrate-binding protein [Snowella sp.]|nr:zinc ABC transporter substrate-binding protein [Snowella sp.]
MSAFFRVAFLALILGSSSLVGCRQAAVPEQVQAVNQIPLTVSIEPQKYFVERIGGDRVNVNVMVPIGTDPHTYEPKPDQMRALAGSKAYFRIGGDLEDAWMPRLLAANSNLNIVDTSQNIEKIPTVGHSHDHGHDHGHDKAEKAAPETGESLDSHIWLSPQRVKQQAQTIYQSLVKLDPQHQAEYEANLKKFTQDLDSLDQDIRQQLTGLKHKTFMVFHPEWGYFAKDYGLTMVAIEVEGSEPSAAELADIIKEAKEKQIKVIFTQPEFSPQTSNAIAQEIGAKVIPISAFSADWLNNMRQVSQTLATELKS